MRLEHTRSWKKAAEMRRAVPGPYDKLSPAQKRATAMEFKGRTPTYVCSTCGADLKAFVGAVRCPNDTPEWPHENHRARLPEEA